MKVENEEYTVIVLPWTMRKVFVPVERLIVGVELFESSVISPSLFTRWKYPVSLRSNIRLVDDDVGIGVNTSLSGLPAPHPKFRKALALVRSM